MAALKFSQRYWRTLHRVPVDVRRALLVTTDAMQAETTLPGPEDVVAILPPTTPAYRRRIGASAWWLYYELRPDGVAVLVAVTVPLG